MGRIAEATPPNLILLQRKPSGRLISTPKWTNPRFSAAPANFRASTRLWLSVLVWLATTPAGKVNHRTCHAHANQAHAGDWPRRSHCCVVFVLVFVLRSCGRCENCAHERGAECALYQFKKIH